MEYKYKRIGRDEDFESLSQALKWANYHKIKIISLSEWQWGYTLLYIEKKIKRRKQT